ncbi:hypothetical protein BH11CYA1_BH11CYA1_27790 [soil metagenome]
MYQGKRSFFAGDCFRSQLEVRWALFFKALELDYVYEKQAYGLLAGWYLPDFWLPTLKVFVEVKPWTGGMVDAARYRELAQSTGYPLLCVQGRPESGRYAVDVYSPARNFHLKDAYFAEAERVSKRLVLVKEDDKICWEVRRGAAVASLTKNPVKADSPWLAVASTAACGDFSK